MRSFVNIAANAFMELVRQPVFLLLMTVSACFGVFLAIVPYFGFGDDPKMVKDSVLALMLLAGLLSSVLSASASVSHEIRFGTALAVLAKPVSRLQFLAAKYLGVALAIALLTYTNMLSALLASRMAYDAYGDIDKFAASIYFVAVLMAYAVSGFTNFFLRRPFVADAVFSFVAFVTIAFIVIACFNKSGEWEPFGKNVDWRLIPASVLILFALFIIAGLAVMASTRLDMMPTLAVCSAFFLLGIMSDYLFGQLADRGNVIGEILYTLVPNWQLFWLSDALVEDKEWAPWAWGYIGKAFAYVAGYLGASLAAALLLFQDRELH